ncbi:hypothetical protein SIN8267_01155 [Sinobacterium norvegicum]|uniref:Fis family transcriptional regulator n=1 Tax=Sinobacterium norvegicum TaxID=1641715 RepID=A0ABN8EGA7_9GAMM|nr:hypothetical protein [Sinobacterium norvegicum]CAH0991054.1 hypothetical protein SIN8267_01155 [Sinobacterium norvegicum]
MRKTDKKTDNQIRQTLTEACEQALDTVEDFSWLTHTVNYNAFPKSLVITCVFTSNQGLQTADRSGQQRQLGRLIADKLKAVGIPLTNVSEQIRFDTEEDCDRHSGGQWHLRLA